LPLPGGCVWSVELVVLVVVVVSVGSVVDEFVVVVDVVEEVSCGCVPLGSVGSVAAHCWSTSVRRFSPAS
jgi:hypothetical protein